MLLWSTGGREELFSLAKRERTGEESEIFWRLERAVSTALAGM